MLPALAISFRLAFLAGDVLADIFAKLAVTDAELTGVLLVDLGEVSARFERLTDRGDIRKERRAAALLPPLIPWCRLHSPDHVTHAIY